MGTSSRASCSRSLSLRGDSLPMRTLFLSQGDFCATAFAATIFPFCELSIVLKNYRLKAIGCRSHIDVGTLRPSAPGYAGACEGRLTGHRHSGIRVLSHAPLLPEGSPQASIAEPCPVVQ